MPAIGETMTPERINATDAARTAASAALVPATLESEDIAALARFLASDESRHINGAIIPADAGWTAA
jgi:NAD(P)-dependent dehydrogenase (short-subunit alcohol dehydrogenase family)